jgi:serine/threonine protein kinase
VSDGGNQAGVSVPGFSGLRVIGRGGFGTVYLAEQERLGRLVALKVLNVDRIDDRDRRRFERESAVTAQLSGHPNIVTVFDSGVTDSGRPFLVMEYFPRGSLADLMLASGPIPWQKVLDIGVKLAGALETAHLAGVLHRDIKPQNVLVTDYGAPALADFGIARLLASAEGSTTAAALSPRHSPPEVLEGKPSSAATDVYSLSSTLYALIEGRAPHESPTDEGIAAQLLRVIRDPVPDIVTPGVAPEVNRVLLAALVKDPAERLQSAAEFGRALQSIQTELNFPATELIVSTPPDVLTSSMPGPQQPAAEAIDSSLHADPVLIDDGPTLSTPARQALKAGDSLSPEPPMVVVATVTSESATAPDDLTVLRTGAREAQPAEPGPAAPRAGSFWSRNVRWVAAVTVIGLVATGLAFFWPTSGASNQAARPLVAVGEGILASTNSENWVSAEIPSLEFKTGTSTPDYQGPIFFDVKSNGRLWIAVGDGGSIVSSTDGHTWTDRTPSDAAANGVLNGVSWNGREWLAVGYLAGGSGPTSLVYSSPDGITWANISPPDVRANLSSVASDGTDWIVVGTSGDGSPDQSGTRHAGPPALFSSADGRSWNDHSPTSGLGVLTKVIWAKSEWVAVGGSYATDSFSAGTAPLVLISDDGRSWRDASPLGMSGVLMGIGSNGSQLVAVGSSRKTNDDFSASALALTSSAGQAWVRSPTDFPADSFLTDVAWNGRTWTATGTSQGANGGQPGGLAWSSPDAIRWDSRESGRAYFRISAMPTS